MMNRKDTYIQITEKYKSKYFQLKDFPAIDLKVVYLPFWDSMIYTLYDNAFDRFQFKPTDILTIKTVNEGERCSLVQVYENKCIFSPAELIPIQAINKEDMQIIREIFEEKNKEKVNSS